MYLCSVRLTPCNLNKGILLTYLLTYLLFLSSPGVASNIVFRGKSASILRIVDDDDHSEKCQRSIFILSRLIKNDCPAFDPQYNNTRISLNESLKACSETLMFLLASISPSLDSSTMPYAMVSHTVTSAKTLHATNLQIALTVLPNHKRSISEFGVISSYNELQRFRISAAVAPQNERQA